MSDCRFGVSPVNYPDPDPDPDMRVYQLTKENIHFVGCMSKMKNVSYYNVN